MTGVSAARILVIRLPMAGVPVVGLPVAGVPIVGVPVVGLPLARFPVVRVSVIGVPVVGVLVPPMSVLLLWLQPYLDVPGLAAASLLLLPLAPGGVASRLAAPPAVLQDPLGLALAMPGLGFWARVVLHLT